MLNNIKDKLTRRNAIYYLAVILMGLTPLLWFKGNLITGEEFYSIDYGNWADLYARGWGSNVNYGEFSSVIPFRFQGYYFQLLSFIGVNYYSSLVSWHVLLWVATALVFFLLVKNLYGEKTNKVVLIVATLFYVFNPFFLNISVLLTPPRLLFIILPIIFLLLFKYAKSSGQYKYLFLLGLVSFIFSPIYVNIPYSSIIFIPIILFLIYWNIVKKSYKKLFLHPFIFCVFFLILNLWWLLPMKTRVQPQVESIQRLTGGFITIDRSDVSDVLSGFGSWAFREKAGDILYFPYYENYDNFPLVVVRYVPFALILIGILLFRKNKENNHTGYFIIFTFFIFWLATFLSKGTSGFGGNIFKFMFENLPMFWLYREPYAKFIPLAAVAGCALLPLTLDIVYKKALSVNKYYSYIFLSAVTIVGLGIGYPIWTSQVIATNNNQYSRSPVVQFPDYWNTIKNDWYPKKGYYLTYPTLGTTDTYMWPSGYSGNPYLMLKKAKIITISNLQFANSGINNITYSLYTNLLTSPDKFTAIAEKYKISGIIFQGDTGYTQNLNKKDYLLNSYGKYKTISAGNSDIYELDTKSDDVVLVNNKDIYTSGYLSPNQYYNVSSALPEGAVIKYVSGPAIPEVIVFTTPINDYINNSFDISNLPENNYRLKIVGDTNYAQNVLLDQVSLNMESGGTEGTGSVSTGLEGFVSKTKDCCNNLTISVKDSQDVLLTQDLTDTKMLNVVKLDNFNPENIYELQIKLTGNTSRNNGLAIIQRDTEADIIQNIGYGVVPQGLNVLNLTYVPTYTLKTTLNPDYYINLFSVDDNGNPTNKLDGIIESVLFKEHPVFTSILFPKKSATENKVVSNGIDGIEDINIYDYRRINESLAVLALNGKLSENILQFKDSYDSNWRLFKIDKKDFENFQKGGFSQSLLAIKMSLINSGIAPLNLEAYSNGWEIDQDEDSNYAIIFTPTYLSDFLLFIAATFASAGVIYIFVKNRKCLVS